MQRRIALLFVLTGLLAFVLWVPPAWADTQYVYTREDCQAPRYGCDDCTWYDPEVGEWDHMEVCAIYTDGNCPGVQTFYNAHVTYGSGGTWYEYYHTVYVWPQC